MKLSFVGAAHEVTGSCHCIEVDDIKILVDCGYFETRQKAQAAIMAGDVKVNGETEFQRGKKLFPGDIVFFNGEEIKITE